MSGTAPTPKRLESDENARIAEALIRRCGLSEDDLHRIRGVQQKLELRFSEAAMLLGYATPTDFAAALAEEPADRVTLPLARAGQDVVIAQEPFSPHSEKLRSLRTELLLRLAPDNGVFAVVSPAAGEGRSRLCAELAVAFAQMGGETLLVDADLRNPRQHRLFVADNARGLADALRTSAPPAVSAVADLPRLMLLTAGGACANPLELLSAPRFTHLVEGWRRRYQHVVIDTPPIGSFADGLAVAGAARQVLSVFRAEHTEFSSAKRMLERLQATQARVLGAVLNRY